MLLPILPANSLFGKAVASTIKPRKTDRRKVYVKPSPEQAMAGYVV